MDTTTETLKAESLQYLQSKDYLWSVMCEMNKSAQRHHLEVYAITAVLESMAAHEELDETITRGLANALETLSTRHAEYCLETISEVSKRASLMIPN